MEKKRRLPPHDEQSKKAVLGTILAEPEEALLAAGEFGLNKADFYLIGANGFIEGEWL